MYTLILRHAGKDPAKSTNKDISKLFATIHKADKKTLLTAEITGSTIPYFERFNPESLEANLKAKEEFETREAERIAKELEEQENNN